MKTLNELSAELYSDPECDGGIIPGRPRVAHDGTVDFDDRPCPCGKSDDIEIPF